MNNMPHIFWGKTSINEREIQSLKRKGLKEIYVLDHNQSIVFLEEDEVFYLSQKGFYLLFKNAPETIHYIYLPPRSKRKK